MMHLHVLDVRTRGSRVGTNVSGWCDLDYLFDNRLRGIDLRCGTGCWGSDRWLKISFTAGGRPVVKGLESFNALLRSSGFQTMSNL